MTDVVVSIVMPCRNAGAFLAATLRSVSEQSEGRWELLLVDDGSTDDSNEIAAHFARKHPGRVRLLEGPRAGAGPARNVGLSKASGRFVAFLDADDVWSRDKLQQQLSAMTTRAAVFSCTAYEVIDGRDQFVRTEKIRAPLSYTSVLEKRCVVGCSTVIYDRATLGERQMPAIRMRQDMALWLELCRDCERQGLEMLALNQPLTRYRVHDAGLSSNKLAAAYYQWLLYSDLEHLGFGKALHVFVKYGLRSIRNRFL